MELFQRFQRIARPFEAHHVATPEAYRARQRAIIAQNRRQVPGMAWRDPFVAVGVTVRPIVSGGVWGILCPACRNFAVYDPAWRLACCCECGAIFQDVAPPAAWAAVERVLMARSELRARNWNVEAVLGVGPAETVDDLKRQNAAAGDPVETEAA